MKKLPTVAQVKKLSTEELVERTKVFSAERWRAISAGKPKEGNRMCWVAASVLDFAPEAAERVLMEIAATPDNGLVGFSAERTLEQWKAGTFHPP